MRDKDKAFGRLAKFCGLLGSNHEGERAAAALKATEALQSMGLTWEDLVKAASGRTTVSVRVQEAPRRPEAAQAGQPFTNPYKPVEGRHVDLCRRMIALHQGELTDWELSFLASLAAGKFRFRELTPNQEASLGRIVERFHPSYYEHRT